MNSLFIGTHSEDIDVGTFNFMMNLLRSRNPELEAVAHHLTSDPYLQWFDQPPDLTGNCAKSTQPEGRSDPASEDTTFWATVKAWLDSPTCTPPTVSCSICLTRLAVKGLPSDEENEKPALLPCGHILGEHCVRHMIMKEGYSTRCPLCRRPVHKSRLAVGVSVFEGEIRDFFDRQERVLAQQQQEYPE